MFSPPKQCKRIKNKWQKKCIITNLPMGENAFVQFPYMKTQQKKIPIIVVPLNLQVDKIYIYIYIKSLMGST